MPDASPADAAPETTETGEAAGEPPAVEEESPVKTLEYENDPAEDASLVSVKVSDFKMFVAQRHARCVKAGLLTEDLELGQMKKIRNVERNEVRRCAGSLDSEGDVKK